MIAVRGHRRGIDPGGVTPGAITSIALSRRYVSGKTATPGLLSEPCERRDARRSRKRTRRWATSRTQRRRPGAPVPQIKEARRGKTRRRQLLFTAMALRPGLVFAEGVGSAFCPLTLFAPPSLFASPPLPAGDAYRCALATRLMRDDDTGLLNEPCERRESPRSRKRIGRRGIRGPERRKDSSTVGDTSPGDAFPASSSLVHGSKPASPSRGSFAVAGLKPCATVRVKCA